MILSWLSKSIDRAVGAGGFNSAQYRDLAGQQVSFIHGMSAAMALGGLAIIIILLAAIAGTDRFDIALTWAVATLGLYAFAFIPFRPERMVDKGDPIRALNGLTARMAILGVAWGLMPVILSPAGDLSTILVIDFAVIGLIVGTCLGFAIAPKAALAHILPIIAGSLIAVCREFDSPMFLPMIGLLAMLTLIMPSMVVLFSRTLVSQIVARYALNEQKNFVSVLLKEFEENASDWLWEFDRSGRIHRLSPRFQSATGMAIDELAGELYLDVIGKLTTQKDVIAQIQSTIANRSAFRDFELPVTVNGTFGWWRLTGKPNYDADGQYLGYIGIGSEVTNEKTAAHEIRLLAHRDSLTGLLNRASFNQEMDSAVASLEQFGTPFGVMFLDLDKFKLVNDTRGHLVGDKLLKAVADRILACVRDSDKVARLGGDEFAVLMRDRSDAGAAVKMASRLINDVSRTYQIDNESHKIGVSIGIALAPINGTRPNQLLRNADLALYRSKAEGRGVFRFFEPQMDADQREKRMLELELRTALDKNEFELFFQPLVSPITFAPTGMEALIRWHHPIRGMISPIEFIPIAEKSTLIQEIGAWSIRRACEVALDWPSNVVVAVNLSAHHFIGSDIVTNTRAALAETGLPPHRLELEITESLLINNTDEALKILKELKALGVTIALDDFGTGYSSLSYALKFPFDKIKIDRSFVKALGEDESAKAILQMIANLGKSLSIRITAEGVETLEQVEFLRSIHCHQFQGFYFAKPLRIGELPEFFQRHEEVPDRAEPSKILRAVG